MRTSNVRPWAQPFVDGPIEDQPRNVTPGRGAHRTAWLREMTDAWHAQLRTRSRGHFQAARRLFSIAACGFVAWTQNVPGWAHELGFWGAVAAGGFMLHHLVEGMALASLTRIEPDALRVKKLIPKGAATELRPEDR